MTSFDNSDNSTATVNNPGSQQPPSFMQAASPETGAPAPAAPTQTTPTTPQQSNPTAQPSQQQQAQVVSNPNAGQTTQPQGDPNASHPLMKRAGLLRSVAESLAGGPRYSIDQDGNRVPV